MSCGWPIRPSGVCASTCLRMSLSAMPAARTPSVSNIPGFDCNGSASAARDVADNAFSSIFAGGVIHDNHRAFSSEVFGDGRTDSFGCASNDGDFTCEFFCVHDFLLVDVEVCKFSSNRTA